MSKTVERGGGGKASLKWKVQTLDHNRFEYGYAHRDRETRVVVNLVGIIELRRQSCASFFPPS